MSRRGWSEEDIPRQDGRVALVTGANSGIGFEAARALATRGASVLLGCRSAEKAERAREHMPGGEVEVVPLDLADLGSVRAAADVVADRFGRLDVLVNNAGIMGVPAGRTADGFELHLGTNHLGHFALTARLFPLLAATPGARVVTVSSQMHRTARLPRRDVDELMGERRYGRWQQYARSKVANLLFAYELQRRAAATGVDLRSLACHPGGVATDLARDTGNLLSLGVPLMRVTMQSPRVGALPTLRAACDPDALGGECFGPRGPGELRGRPVRVVTSGLSRDRELARWLWDVSEDLTGCSWPW